MSSATAWLRFDDPVALAFAKRLGLTPLNAETCRALIRPLREVLVEPHIPKTSRAGAFFMRCSWAEDFQSITPGDLVIITGDFKTYYVVNV